MTLSHVAGNLKQVAKESTSTREKLILTAESMFAEQGIEAVSLRSISAEAVQGNNSAVQYHFDTKLGLIEAIMDYRISRIDDRRSSLLMAAETRGRLQDVRCLLEVFLLPLCEEVSDPNSRYMSLLSQIYHHHEDPGHPYTQAHGRALARGRAMTWSVGEMLDALMQLPRPISEHRSKMIGLLFVHSLADRERMQTLGVEMDLQFGTFVVDLLDAAQGIFLAPSTIGS